MTSPRRDYLSSSKSTASQVINKIIMQPHRIGKHTPPPTSDGTNILHLSALTVSGVAAWGGPSSSHAPRRPRIPSLDVICTCDVKTAGHAPLNAPPAPLPHKVIVG